MLYQLSYTPAGWGGLYRAARAMASFLTSRSIVPAWRALWCSRFAEPGNSR